MKKIALLSACLLILAVGIGCKSPEQIEEAAKENKTVQEIVFRQELEREERTLTVYGTGKVNATPDVAAVELTVSVQESTAEAAQSKNNETMAAVLETLKSMGVKDDDIKTQEVTVFPIQDAEKQSGEITGYSATNTIHVSIYTVRNTGEIVAAAMQAGANELVHVEFHLLDETEAYKEALAAAVEDARQKADVMATSLSVDLNGPGSVQESTNLVTEANSLITYPSELMGLDTEAGEVSATPLQAGLISVTAEVTVVYMLRYPATATPTPAP